MTLPMPEQCVIEAPSSDDLAAFALRDHESAIQQPELRRESALGRRLPLAIPMNDRPLAAVTHFFHITRLLRIAPPQANHK
jgi:hypothetical protein